MNLMTISSRGQVGLTITRRILDRQPQLQLFSLRAVAAHRRLDIALDKASCINLLPSLRATLVQ